MSGSLRRTVLAGALSVLLGASLVQTVGTTSAGAVNFDPCRRWTFYLVTGSPASWSEAKTIARRMGGKLAVIQSAAENACAAAATDVDGCGGCAIWIGGSDISNDGVWRWDGGNARDARVVFYVGDAWTGSPPRGVYSGFVRDSEPNGSTGENCLMSSGYGAWNDLGCGNVLPFLVEY